MKFIFAIFNCVMLVVLVSGCSKFSKSYFITKAFDVDLSDLIKNKRTKYSDGCLQVFDVQEGDPLLLKTFTQNIRQEKIGIEVGDASFSVSRLGEIRYRILSPGFDEYTRVIFYIPRDHRLVFAYATGLGG